MACALSWMRRQLSNTSQDTTEGLALPHLILEAQGLSGPSVFRGDAGTLSQGFHGQAFAQA